MSRISGNLGLTSICVLGNLDLQGAHISGILICIADIDRIQSKRTRFQVTGNFYISFSTIEQHVVLHGADVGGNIELDAATIKGSVCAGGEIPLVVGGDLILSAAKISWIHFAAAKISGKISCVTGEFSQLKFDAGLVRTSRWDGIEEHWICPCQAAGVVIRSISVKDKASLLGIKVHHGGQGSSDGEGKGSLIFTGSTVGNDLTLGEDETVDKILAQVDRSKGSIQWNPCPDTLSDRHPLYFEFNPPQDRDLGGHVRVDVDLSGTVVGGAMNLSALFTGEIICLAKASVGGDLKAPRLGTSRSSGSRVSTVCGHLNMDMLSIGGDASLTGLKVEKLKDELIPDVYARGLTVKGKIEFANNGDKDCAQIEGVLDLSKASANELVISGSVLQKTGSADLKGVRPKGCLQRMLNGFILLLSAPIKGMLDLLRKFVDGILSLCLRFLWWCLGGQPPKFDRETIDSKFALDKIGFTRKRDILLYVLALRYSQGCTGVDDAFRHTRHMVDKHREALGQSFAKVLLKISKAPKEPVLVLERASFDRLDFLKPFPLDVDLSGIRVGKWEAGADDMQRILEKTTPFYRGTYLDVEKALKSKGYESQAAKIYRTMRLKAENDLSGWRWLGSWLAGRFTGYWTQSWRLVPIFLASFVLTFSVFDNQANVVAVTGVLEVQGSDRGPKTLGEKLAQKPIDLDRDILWTWQDAAGLTVRYTIPVVSLFPAERWIPGRELLKVTLPTCKLYDSLGHKNQASLCADWWWESSWITPEFFAMFVSAIMWLAWPVFLVGISGVIRREK